MNKLYNLTWITEENRKLLYYKSNDTISVTEGVLCLKESNSIDLLTYFNCFSVRKWKQYTTITQLVISLKMKGEATLCLLGLSKNGRRVISTMEISGDFEFPIDLCDIDEDILGLCINAKTDCNIQEISYYGSFVKSRQLKIGVSICTFKREIFVKRTVEKLERFSKYHPWLRVLVVDNGSTLKERDNGTLRIVHNPNYGGSGGFTRGLIENLEKKENDYVLLMDDDIDLEVSSLDRMYGLLCGLKDEYTDSFLSGAMLRMDSPCIQYENTAYWGKIRLHSLGKGWDLSKEECLLKNELIGSYINQYGAWWYCCIPLKRVEEIGLPLPVFVKGDDMEYGIRNNKELIYMNGIGVWHETFESKQALWVNYFSDRNMLIINHYAAGCNRLTFFVAIIGRLLKRSLKMECSEIMMLENALRDVFSGFSMMTSIGLDKKLENVRGFQPSGNILRSMIKILIYAFKGLVSYRDLNDDYRAFRRDKLSNARFWNNYMIRRK